MSTRITLDFLAEWHGQAPHVSEHPAGMTLARFGVITYFIQPDGRIWFPESETVFPLTPHTPLLEQELNNNN